MDKKNFSGSDLRINAHFKTVSRILRLSAAAFLCASFIFAANRYYEVKDASEELFSKIQVTVFFDKQNRDGDKTLIDIESLGLINLSEYVPAQQAYSKAVEKNAFLKDILVPQDANYFSSYAVFLPTDVPSDDYLTLMRAAVMQIDGVDEIIFNRELCRQYAQMANVLRFYKIAGAFFAAIIFVFFALQCILRILNRGEYAKKTSVKRLAVEISAYLISCAIGFVILWGVCQFVQYPLLIDETAAFIIIPLASLFGTIFK